MDKETLGAFRDCMAQIFALQAMVNALVATHQNPQALSAAYAQFAASVSANVLSMAWEDEQVEYVEEQLKSYQNRLPRV